MWTRSRYFPLYWIYFIEKHNDQAGIWTIACEAKGFRENGTGKGMVNEMRKRVTAAAAAIAVLLSQAGMSAPAALAQYTPEQLTEISYNYDGSDHTRLMEKLDRGLVAVRTGSGI